jgi:hypothetical protein
MNAKTTRRFGPYPAGGTTCLTAEASRVEGYERGLTWTAPWQPGGPHVVTPGIGAHGRDPDWIAYCAATRENNREWLEGFAAGRADAAART